MTVDELLVFGKSHIHKTQAEMLLAVLLNVNSLELLLMLDKIIDENYIGQFNSENQIGGRCWAWALSAIIYLASSRVFGRKIEKFKNIKDVA